MADAAAGGAVVQVLLQNLLSMLSGEIKLVHGFRDELAKLQDALITTQEFLSDAEDKEIKDIAAKKWLQNLEDVAFEADNVLDEINYHLLRKKVKNQKRKKEVSSSSSSSSVSFLFRIKMVPKINDLNKKLENSNKNAVINGLQKKVVKAPNASAIGIVETDSFSVEPNIVGRENDVAKIVEMVVNAPLDEKISVIPIVGMGGLGKTTVAQRVFNDKEIINHFQKRIWVCASDFDEVALFQKILETLTGEGVQGIVTKEVMLQNIQKNLASKKYLLILDDVWNADFIKWEGFMKSLLGISNKPQNLIVITTRLESVASRTKTLSFHTLTSLTADDCWSIIKVKSLSSVDEQLEYEEVGMCIARKCSGLPLAANVIGGMLRERVKDEEEAKRADLFGKPDIVDLVLDWTRSREGEKNDENVLKGFQPHPNLKSLAICGYESINFPSWTMKMSGLTNLMNIHIEDCECENLPSFGHLPRLKLLELKNLQHVKCIDRSFYGLEYCSTSSVIDEINSIPKTILVFQALEKLWLKDMPNLVEWADVESGVVTFPCLKYLEIKSCTQLESVPNRFRCLEDLRIEEIGGNVCLTNIITNSTSLHTLEIKSYSGILHSPDLQEDSITLFHPLQSLQNLYIIDCPQLNSIPNFDLRSLQKLFIRNCPALKCLPLELIESCSHSLQELMLVDLPNLENIDYVMSSISRMSGLQRLSLLHLPKLTNLPIEIGSFMGLWFLGVGRFSESVDQVSYNDFLQRIFHGSPRLQNLSLFGNMDWVSLPNHIQHLSLYELWIAGYGIEALPEWIGNFSSLQRLSILNCKRLCHLPSKETMQRLTKLSHLWIKRCPLLKTQQESTSGDADSEWPKISHIEYVKVDDELLPSKNTPAAEKKFTDFNPNVQRYTD